MRPSLATEEPLRRLLLAAESELAERGFHAASLNDILKAAGTSKGSFYHHFEDKEALFVAVLRAGLADLPAEPLRLSGKDLRAALTQSAAQLMAWSLSHPHFVPLCKTFYGLYGEGRWPKVQALWAEAEALVVAELSEAQARGLVRDDLPAPLLATLVMTVSSALDRAMLDQPPEVWTDGAEVQRWVRRMADLWTRLLAP
ncbi:TetR/AcrR family transcriptional regulator [Myxococcota bacterium]|nr:TetR/AcrR family transcriptional regulator [Myxococcota bacterium]